MGDKFELFIKFCAPRLFRLPGQSLLGCGPTRWCLVFCSPSGLFHLDPKLTPITRTWYRQDNFIVTSKYSSTYRDWPARTTETNSYPGLFTRSVGRAKNAAPRH